MNIKGATGEVSDGNEKYYRILTERVTENWLNFILQVSGK
jgi:hypothetical protein